MKVAIVDYGSGNLHSAHKAFERAAREAGLRADVRVTADPEWVFGAERIVLPGVGAFADCRRGLDAATGMVEAMTERVRRQGAPFLGICVGMQLLATRGLEHELRGRARLDSRRRRGDPPVRPVAENSPYGLEYAGSSPRTASLDGVSPGRHADSVHSDQLYPAEPADIVATADYARPDHGHRGARQCPRARSSIPRRARPWGWR